MPPDVRDTLAELSAACEGKPRCLRVDAHGTQTEAGDTRGSAVRLEWSEARDMSTAATTSMAHMSLDLHDAYDLDDACAVDGSLLPGTDGAPGSAAWAWWRGVSDDDDIDAGGAALPYGSNIADAEMTAIDACMRSAERRRSSDTRAPRLLVLSDCTAVIQALETGWAGGSAWLLHRQHRASLLEAILMRMARWRRNGGIMIIQWTPAHKGVFPNHYADVAAKAGVGREASGPYASHIGRQASLVQYKVEYLQVCAHPPAAWPLT